MSRTTQVLSTLHFASVTGLSPSMVDVSTSLLLASLLRCREPYNPGDALRHCRFGLVPVRSPLLGESLNCSLFLWVLRCFSSPRSLHHRMVASKLAGLPYSDICGSSRICRSPQLFAAYHVLRRLSEPRHPPNALLSLYLYLHSLQYISKKVPTISITLLVYHQ